MGCMDGPGTFTWADGLKYEGEFVRNMPMGQGTYTWPDGSSYKGEVFNGIRHGYGIYTSAKNGVSYKGHWHRGKRHGKGAVYYNQEETSWYKGDWVMNNREGWGVRCYASGNVYCGEWKNNLRNGEGTMKWLKLGQQYVGKWQDGVQHGQGIHIWIQKRMDGSQYCQSNQYTGEFVKGQRHGQGTFYYAGGAVYAGEWRNNKKHGQGKFNFSDGHALEVEFVDDQMITPNLIGNRAPASQALLAMSGEDLSTLGPDMTLNIKCLLEKIPVRKRNVERQQVEFVVLRNNKELRSVYSFYSRLGQRQSPKKTYVLSRMQLWRLLKDCNIHHHGTTLTTLDLHIREDAITAEIHSPFTPMLLCRVLSCLVILAYHIYHKDMALEKYLLAACFSKLLTDDIFPNAKIVKGFVFRQPERGVVAVSYLRKCWEIYQAFCRVNRAPRDDWSMTCKHMLWMFKDLRLFDDKLTPVRLVEIITGENPDHSNAFSGLDLEITFLEFFEALIGCAEVKCQQVSEGLDDESQSASSPEGEATGNSPTEETSDKTLQTTNSPPKTPSKEEEPKVDAPLDISSHKSAEEESKVNVPTSPHPSGPKSAEKESQRNVPTSIDISGQKSAEAASSSETPESTSAQDVEGKREIKTVSASKSAEHTDEVQTTGVQAQENELETWIQMVNQFFNHCLFPAFDHHQLVMSNMMAEKRHNVAQ